MNVRTKFVVRSFARSWDNSDCSFGLGLRTHNLAEGEALGGRGTGMVPFERALVICYNALHSNLSSIFTRFRDRTAFVLQHATFSHPTSSLPKISPCSPGIRWMTFGVRRAKVEFVSKISNLCGSGPDPPTLQTDGRTDGRHAISIPRFAL